MTRFLIRDSVDDKLEEMQQLKAYVVGSAMSERNMLAKLSQEQIMSLFGNVTRDKKTKKLVISMEENEILDAILPP